MKVIKISKKFKKFQKEIDTLLSVEQFKRIYINNIKTDYIASSYGRIISMKNDDPIVLRPWIHKDHMYVSLCVESKVKRFQLHRLIAVTFIPNPDKNPIVHHIDKNPLNNHVDNLIWCTEVEHKFYHKDEMDINRSKNKIQYGSACNLSVYTDTQINYVCQLFEENNLTIPEICRLTDVKLDTLRRILRKEQWVVISKNYNIDNYSLRGVQKKHKEK